MNKPKKTDAKTDNKNASVQANSDASTEAQKVDVEVQVKAYLDANLEELVKAAMPETPEQQAERERVSEDESIEAQRKKAAARNKREAKARDAAAAAAAADQAKRDEAAAKSFAEAEPFTGPVADLTAKTVRGILIDDGKAHSADHKVDIRFSELEPTQDGGLLLTKAVELSARSREFSVKGVSLVTDAGVLRIALNGNRKCGGGKAISFPAKSLLFRPASPVPEQASDENAAE